MDIVAYYDCTALQANVSSSMFHFSDSLCSLSFLISYLQILVWHTRTEKPVLVNEGKKGFTDSKVEIWHASSRSAGNSGEQKIAITQCVCVHVCMCILWCFYGSFCSYVYIVFILGGECFQWIPSWMDQTLIRFSSEDTVKLMYVNWPETIKAQLHKTNWLALPEGLANASPWSELSKGSCPLKPSSEGWNKWGCVI